MSRRWRRLILLILDLIAAVVAILLGFVIRFAFDGKLIPQNYLMAYLHALPLILPVRILVYYALGLYRQAWAHASVPELLRVVWAVTLDSAISTFILFGIIHPTGFPRSVFVIGWIFKIGLLGSIRLVLRMRHEWQAMRSSGIGAGRKTLIFGAGDAGAMLAREFAKHPELGCTVIGFLDDNQHKAGDYIAGKPVLGTRAEMAAVVQRYDITNLVIAIPSAGNAEIRGVIEAGRDLNLHLQTLPGLYELVGGRVSITQVRDVQIEDVLGRAEIKVDLQAIAAYLTDEIVLVTGAGGSIGSELCRQIGRFGPAQLILLGHGENSIYEIDMELRQAYPQLDIQPVVADIQDEQRINHLFERYRPGVVFHAAAHKHVPLMEQNPSEAIKNNVFGTYHVAKAADQSQTKRFVLISTDKAVNPTSVMGATKRAAELIVQSFARSSKTIFVAVRFGNVLGSRGSVVQVFKRQIAAGGPVTVTDPRMVRYFMTIPEAVQLLIQAAALGAGGETFALDMGKPVRIDDLAREMIRLSGLRPDIDIPIVYTGNRGGEKLYEEVLTAEEGTIATQHQRIFCTRASAIHRRALENLLRGFHELLKTEPLSSELVLALITESVKRTQMHGVAGLGD